MVEVVGDAKVWTVTVAEEQCWRGEVCTVIQHRNMMLLILFHKDLAAPVRLLFKKASTHIEYGCMFTQWQALSRRTCEANVPQNIHPVQQPSYM
jgi:hypothetical protein